MSFTHGRAKTGGRKRGARNKKTVAPKTYPDALDHLAAVIASKDAAIPPDLKVRAAIGLAQYQHPKPTPSRAASSRSIWAAEDRPGGAGRHRPNNVNDRQGRDRR